jgi:hypothetical protein
VHHAPLNCWTSRSPDSRQGEPSQIYPHLNKNKHRIAVSTLQPHLNSAHSSGAAAISLVWFHLGIAILSNSLAQHYLSSSLDQERHLLCVSMQLRSMHRASCEDESTPASCAGYAAPSRRWSRANLKAGSGACNQVPHRVRTNCLPGSCRTMPRNSITSKVLSTSPMPMPSCTASASAL